MSLVCCCHQEAREQMTKTQGKDLREQCRAAVTPATPSIISSGFTNAPLRCRLASFETQDCWTCTISKNACFKSSPKLTAAADRHHTESLTCNPIVLFTLISDSEYTCEQRLRVTNAEALQPLLELPAIQSYIKNPYPPSIFQNQFSSRVFMGVRHYF